MFGEKILKKKQVSKKWECKIIAGSLFTSILFETFFFPCIRAHLQGSCKETPLNSTSTDQVLVYTYLQADSIAQDGWDFTQSNGVFTLTESRPRPRPMESSTELNGIGHCLGLCFGLCAVCNVLHITTEPNSIGLCLGVGLGLGLCQCEHTIMDRVHIIAMYISTNCGSYNIYFYGFKRSKATRE